MCFLFWSQTRTVAEASCQVQKAVLGYLCSFGVFPGLAVYLSLVWASVLTSEKPVLLTCMFKWIQQTCLLNGLMDSIGSGITSCPKD